MPRQVGGEHVTEQLLGGRYRLVRLLGEGGMGQVWEARDETLERTVAVKVISLLAGGGSRGDEARARFLREARITARLQHPNIVTLHDLGETGTGNDRVPFLVMELVRGEGLDAKLRRGAVAARDAARWGAQIARALAEAHDGGVLHRDIKPSNILITPAGTVKVLDFGVARAADPGASGDHLTRTGFIVGTPAYMAPEQARGHPEPRSDLYALGCVLFELLTGRLPFPAPDTVGHLAAHLTQEPPAPGALVPGIPPAWDDLVLTLLRKDPARRHPDALALAGALDLIGGAPPPPTVPDATTPPRPPTAPAAPAPAGGTRRSPRGGAASVPIALSLLCLPGLATLIFQSAGFIQADDGAPIGLLWGNLALAVLELILLVVGAVLLSQRLAAGRWTLVATAGTTALHGLSPTVQMLLSGGQPAADMPGATLVFVVGPVTSCLAIAAVITVLRPSVAHWCLERPAALR
ncbi:serine/threonine-protein kinase [Streptomyces xiamenensis]